MAVLPTGIGPVTGYNIERSLRFNSADSAYLNRTPASASNRKTWTWSGWVKRSALGVQQNLFSVFDYLASPTTNKQHGIRFLSGDTLEFWLYQDPSYNGQKITTQVFRDASAWYHIVAVWDTTQATAADRMKLYVNGSQITTFGTSTNPTLNSDGEINRNFLHTIGTFYDPDFGSPTTNLSGYLTEINFIDGSAKTPSDFGETDAATGVWKPKAYSGTYGTNGFFLKFADNSGTTSTTLGKDSSSNGNNWTPNNFSVTAGAGNDSLVDSPTSYGTDTGIGGEVRGNYCTLNPLQSGTTNITYSNGNLTASQGNTTAEIVRGTIALPTTGKWYWEATITSTSPSLPGIGIINTANTSSALAAGAYFYCGSSGASYNNGSFTTYGATFTNGDVIGVAFDADAGTLVFYKNNSSQGTFASSLTATYAPAMSVRINGTSGSFDVNFGQRAFAYTAPSGFKALCTTNLPTQTIGATSATLAGKYFNPIIYTGTGSVRSLTGVGFQPDLVWIKGRSQATGHGLFNSVIGATKGLSSDSNAAQFTDANSLTAFNSDGFSLGTDATNNFVNVNTQTYVAWNWNAGGSNATNTAGTITSTVRANTTSGFSVVSFNAGSAGNKTVGHGLGASLNLWIMKSLSTANNSWSVGSSALATPASNYLVLNGTAASTSDTRIWANAAPTSTVFSFESNYTVPANADCIAYCFAAVAGYSAFGSYTGNASTDGPFIYTGFRPRFVMWKNTTTAGYNWEISDTARDTYNVMLNVLGPNSSAAESAFAGPPYLDAVSNGFKIRTGSASSGYQNINNNNDTYIYAAFAESPFKYSLAR